MTAKAFWALHVGLIGVGFLVLLIAAIAFRSVLSPAGRQPSAISPTAAPASP
jgi:hypothetical protein